MSGVRHRGPDTPSPDLQWGDARPRDRARGRARRRTRARRTHARRRTRARRRDPAAPDPRAARVQHAIIHGQSALYPLVYLAVIDEFGVTAATVVILSTIGGIASGLLQYAFGVADPLRSAGRRCSAAAGCSSAPGWRPRRSRPASRGFASPTWSRGSAARRSTRSATRCSPSSSRRTGSGRRSRPMSRAATSARSSSARPPRWRSPRSGGEALGRDAGRRRASWSRSPSSRSCASARTTAAAQADGPGPRHLPARPRGPRPALAVHRRGARRRVARPRRAEHLRPALPRPGRRPRRADDRARCTRSCSSMSVPGPLVAGWLSDRIGRRPVIVGVYLAGAASIALFVLAGDDVLRLWIGIVLLSAVLVRREPAAPGAARRRHASPAPRRRVRDVLRARVRRRLDAGGSSTGC